MDWSTFLPEILLTVQKIICYILGYLTILLGYKLVSSGVKGEFKFSASYKGVKGGLISSSPGLLFVLLGVCLIGYAMFVDKTVKSKEQRTNYYNADTLYRPPVPQKVDPLQ